MDGADRVGNALRDCRRKRVAPLASSSLGYLADNTLANRFKGSLRHRGADRIQKLTEHGEVRLQNLKTRCPVEEFVGGRKLIEHFLRHLIHGFGPFAGV